jgi:hypothetical protein
LVFAIAFGDKKWHYQEGFTGGERLSVAVVRKEPGKFVTD